MPDRMLKRTFKTQKLKQDILTQVQRGELRPGDPVLSLNALKARYSMARGSAEKAIRELVRDGTLMSVQGKGCFVAQPSGDIRATDTCVARKKMLIGLAYPMHASRAALVAELEDYALERGSILNVYDVSGDRQSPVNEKRFLETLALNGGSGVIVYPTPLPPTNSDVYRRLRADGVKVALVEYYQHYQRDDVAFLHDYHYAGYLAAAESSRRGYARIAMVKLKLQPVFTRLVDEGVEHARREFPLDRLDDLILEWDNSTDDGSTERNVQLNQAFLQQLTALPSGTALLAQHTDVAKAVKILITQAGRKTPGDLGVLFCGRASSGGDCAVSGCVLRDCELLRAALEYMLDDAIKPDFIFQRLVEPYFDDRGTL